MKSRGSSPRAPGWGVVCAEVDHADVHLAGDGGDDVVLAHQALGDEHLAEAPSAVVLAGEGAVQLLLGDQAAGDEQGAELEAAVGALLAAARPARRAWAAARPARTAW